VLRRTFRDNANCALEALPCVGAKFRGLLFWVVAMTVDTDPDVTFAAVGRAITAWETLEAHLSYLYSIFVDKPLAFAALDQYGRENKIFNDRMTALCKAGRKYFQRCPSQKKEGEVDSLIAETRRLSVFRHQIAHGAVIGKEMFHDGEDVIAYSIVPASHSIYSLTKTTTPYSYNSTDIHNFELKFAAHAERVRAFNHALCPIP
jgi:hypothetical protein